MLTSCPELTTTRTITNLMTKSHALGCVQALVGAKTNKVYFGQIALRNPKHGCLPAAVVEQPIVQMFLGLNAGKMETDRVPMPFWERFWHIDGWPSARNGVAQQVQNFTVLVGVMLSDAVVPNSGNLTVYPGSHRVIEEVLREVGGPQAVFTSPSGGAGTNTNDDAGGGGGAGRGAASAGGFGFGVGLDFGFGFGWGLDAGFDFGTGFGAVSYTHLTLPTKG